VKFSVVTPSFNTGKYIEGNIRSIVDQDYYDLEHIVIDGGSSDGTINVLKKYPHLKWISEPDKGIYDAMNKGVKMASGEWLYFMGADDVLMPGTLKKISKEVEMTDLHVVYGDVVSSRFNGKYGGEFSELKLFQNNFCHQSIFFRRDVFSIVGNFNLKYASHSDWDHNFRWFMNHRIKHKYIDHVIAEYADGGFSSVNFDDVFAKDKRYKFIKYGWKSAPGPFIQMLCKQEFIKGKFSLVRKLVSLMVFGVLWINSGNS
jgi:glycosyltransferase involved in cell wall biosynthesis